MHYGLIFNLVFYKFIAILKLTHHFRLIIFITLTVLFFKCLFIELFAEQTFKSTLFIVKQEVLAYHLYHINP